MKFTRLFATSAAAALILTFAACGSDDDLAPTSSAPAANGSDANAQTPTSDAQAPSTPVFSDDDQIVTDPNLRAELEKIALSEVGEGTVTEVEHNTPDADDNDTDDLDHAFQVEIALTNGEDVTVDVAEDMTVVRVED